jgi:DNA-binding transcriptional LysR family regulator
MIVPALPTFMAQHPELTLDITLSDERRDLVANNIDVAVWMGHLPDSEIVARRLSPSQRIVCASPAYLARKGIPRAPEDLRQHDCLLYTARSYGNGWAFSREGRQEEIAVQGTLRTDNALVLLSAALSGMGLIVVHEWMVRLDISQGRLARVLGDYTVNPRPGDAELYAVYPSSRGLSRKVRAFVDFLVTLFGGPQAADVAGGDATRPGS